MECKSEKAGLGIRLVHEQGRPQIGRGWGTPDAPDCTGFSFGEFAEIDFDQMNLTEYMQYIQSKVALSPAEMDTIAEKHVSV